MIVPSRTEYGRMVDFLRENSWCSVEQYKWEFSIPQIRLMSHDFTHVEYLDREKVEKDKNTIKIESAEDLLNMNDFGFPMIKKPSKDKKG